MFSFSLTVVVHLARQTDLRRGSLTAPKGILWEMPMERKSALISVEKETWQHSPSNHNSEVPANRGGESLRIGRCSTANARARLLSGNHRGRRRLYARADFAVEPSREKASLFVTVRF